MISNLTHMFVFLIVTLNLVLTSGQTQDTSSTNNHWQYSPSQGTSPGTAYNGPSDYVSGHRISGMGSPILTLLPVLMLCGLGGMAVIFLFLTFMNPMGLGGLFGGSSYSGAQYPYGKKRSLEQNKLQQNVMNIFNQVIKAFEKFDVPSTSSSTVSEASSS